MTTTAVRPTIVALVRGVILAAVAAGIAAATAALTTADLGDLAWLVPILLVVLRTLEGRLDELKDPTRQEGLLGGAPAAPIAPHGPADELELEP